MRLFIPLEHATGLTLKFAFHKLNVYKWALMANA